MQKTFTISFNKDLAQVVSKEMKRGKFENTSEFFRDLVRQRFLWNGWEIEEIDFKDSDYKEAKRAVKHEKFVSLGQALKGGRK